MKEKKNSIIAGGLAGTAGIFITKAIGILYVTPFYKLATDANVAYYGYAYDIYNLLLNITASGIPFAVAVVISKYIAQEDYKSAILTRKLANALMLGIGLVAMVILLVFATPIARIILTSDATPESLERTKNVIMIISLALFTVPVLGSFRGYYQGLKNFKLYSLSQVLEQLVRVSFLLGVGFILVYIAKMDNMWAVYMAVLSTSVSALIALGQLFIYQQNHNEINEYARNQTIKPKEPNMILKELIIVAFPYLITSILNNVSGLANLIFFNRNMLSIGYSESISQLYYSMISVSTNKLISIPQVLSLGFSIAIIPIITGDIQSHNMPLLKKHIRECLETVLYIIIPVIVCMAIGADKIYLLFYGASSYEIGADVLRTQLIFGLVSTLSATVMSIMMALRERYTMVVALAIGAAAQFSLITPLMMIFSYRGAIFANIASSLIVLIIGLIMMRRVVRINIKLLLRKLLFILFAAAVSWLLIFLIRLTPLGVHSDSRMLAMLQLIVYFAVGLSSYLFITYRLHVFQSIFKLKFNLPTKKRKS